ncbi:MAG: phosphate ABC transporter substrate-binding protein [Alphaproteobacteria bacterium TMED89]|nr:phosphate ABC transporter substrate-binding protein [Rhodospirillaceae bacterium]RPH12408.1 MAG: phosphate ABC transporter substrate-binding protein [Alphaproteobacteria bacterium TMED89]
MRLVSLMLVGLLAAGTATAQRAETISIVGSSTVFPFSTKVAETFGETTDFNTPVIESTGSGGGMKLFCAGVGVDHPDITNASRAMKSSEAETCTANGVEFTEFVVGFDGIVVANSNDAGVLELSREILAKALLAEVPNDDCSAMSPNTAANWADVDSSLPDVAIEVLGPPTSSGTRDAFEELVFEKAMKAMGCDKATIKAASVREDGAYVEAGENDTLIVDQLASNPTAVGIFGYSFLANNADRIQGANIEGVAPTFENIAGGDYKVSRSLFFYVKNNHLGVIPGIAEYVQEFTSEEAFGAGGYLEPIGLIPLPQADRDANADKAAAL